MVSEPRYQAPPVKGSSETEPRMGGCASSSANEKEGFWFLRDLFFESRFAGAVALNVEGFSVPASDSAIASVCEIH